LPQLAGACRRGLALCEADYVPTCTAFPKVNITRVAFDHTIKEQHATQVCREAQNAGTTATDDRSLAAVTKAMVRKSHILAYFKIKALFSRCNPRQLLAGHV
jgi:hypothetical protein